MADADAAFVAKLIPALQSRGLLKDGRFAPLVVQRFLRALPAVAAGSTQSGMAGGSGLDPALVKKLEESIAKVKAMDVVEIYVSGLWRAVLVL